MLWELTFQSPDCRKDAEKRTAARRMQRGCSEGALSFAHRQEMSKELLVHVGLPQKGAHKHLPLSQAQARAAVDVAIQVPPAASTCGSLLRLMPERFLASCIVSRSQSCMP